MFYICIESFSATSPEDFLVNFFMNTSRDPEEFYNSLRKKLSNDRLWPSNYLYKFIVPSDEEKVEQIVAVFNGMGAEITNRVSSKGNFSSVSVHVKMNSADAVIEKYQEVAVVEGVISL